MFFAFGFGQDAWEVRKSSCLPNDKSPGILAAGYFFDEKTGWLVGETGRIKSSAIRIVLRNDLVKCGRSIDSGISSYDDVYFADKNHGWIVGSKLDDRYGKVRAVLLESKNAGASWLPVDLSSTFPDFYEQTDFDAIYFSPTGGYILAKKSDGKADNLNGFILKSDSKGELWEIVYSSSVDTFFEDIAFDNSGRYGWAITNQGTIYNSDDWGRTWKEQNFKFQESLSKIFVIDSSEVWITSQSSSLLHTTDGGHNWTSVGVNVDKEIMKKYAVWFSGIFFKGKMEGWIGGSGGLIMKTSNGGETWKIDSYGHSNFIYEIQPAGKNLVAIGQSEILVLQPPLYRN